MNKEKKVAETREFYKGTPFPWIEGMKKRFEEIYFKELGMDLSCFKDKEVLDAGCGSGIRTEYFREKGGQVTAIDINTEVLERVGGREMSVLDMQFQDESFDTVHSVGILHHTPDARKGFSECCRVLKGGGNLVVAIYNRDNIFYPITFNLAKILPKKPLWRMWKFGWQKIIKTNKTEEQLKALFSDQWETPVAHFFSVKQVTDWMVEEGIMLKAITGTSYFGFMPKSKRALVYYWGVKK